MSPSRSCPGRARTFPSAEWKCEGPVTDVLIVDDEVLIRSGLRAIIDAEPGFDVVGEAGDGAEVLPLVRSLRPDVVLMDVRMPAVDGIQATRNILASVPE